METEGFNETLTLLVHGERLVVNSRILNVSLFLKMLTETFPSQEIPIDDEKITVPLIKKIMEYCEMHDFNPPKISRPLQSGDLSKILCEKDYLFIKDYNYETGEELPSLIEAAIYFQIQELQDLCICRIAADFYSGDDQNGFENLKKKHKIEGEVTLEEEHRLKLEYPWISN